MHLGTLFASIWFGFISLFGFGHPATVPMTTPGLETASTSMTASGVPSTEQSTTATTEHSSAAETGTSETSSAGTQAAATHYAAFDVTAIPLGDGKVSTSAKVGYVYSCQQTFNGGGASHDGGWIHGTTWNLTEKTQVEGKVYWDNATFSNAVSGALRTITGNGLPVDEPTGTYPIAQSDPAWQIDRNPNSIEVQHVNYSLSANPTFAKSPSCVPMGAIGIALDGVAIYNALDEAGRDAVAHEVQDLCEGHPQGAGEYHYHGPSSCMPNATKGNTVVGYALDGFPITSMYDASGHYYTDADLDACHGMTSTYTDEKGATHNGYHYVLTQEYPYTLGCFMGTPVSAHAGSSGQQTSQQTASGSSPSGPPQAAIDACSGKSTGASCSFSPPNGTVNGTCKMPPNQTSLTCVPA